MNKQLDSVEIGTWVLIQWLADSGNNDLVHHHDLEKLKALLPYGASAPSTSIGMVVGFESEFAVIKFNGEEFRMVPAKGVVKPVSYDGQFDVSDVVSVVDLDYHGTVVCISWHYKEAKPIFRLKVGGKLKSRRYFSEDLELR